MTRSQNTLKMRAEFKKMRRACVKVYPLTPGFNRAYLRKRARALANDVGLSWPKFKQLAREQGGLRNLAMDAA
mgnify:CR=1 FL=1